MTEPEDAGASADAAFARGDSAAALLLWDDQRRRFPDRPAAYLRAAELLERTGRAAAAEAIVSSGVARCPGDLTLALHYVRLAIERGDAAAAQRRWGDACERFAADETILAATTGALLAQGRHADAERVLEETARRFPDVPTPLIGHARLAQDRRDWPAAYARWEAVRARFPDLPTGTVNVAIALRHLGRLDAAEALLHAAIARFPDDPTLAAEHAGLANHCRDWDEAIARWSQFRARFPDDPRGYTGGSWALRERRDVVAAAALIAQGLDRFPDDAGLLHEHAWAAEQQCDWPAAADRWRQARARAPDQPTGYLSAPAVLRRLGRDAEAEAVLAEGLARFPDDPAMHAAFAADATGRGNHAEALARWHAARRRFPLDRDIQTRWFEARLRRLDSAPATGAGEYPDGASAPEEAAAPNRAMYDVMMAFESLGGALLGCEFGGVQRAFGAEPLGLLRWADLAPEHLGAALECRFAGVGDPDNTELSVAAEWEPPEYVTRDKRFHMAMHTFVPAAEVPAETMFASACRRLRYLRRKLIEDLGGGTKIFVYKLTFRDLTDAELGRIHAAIRRYGDNTLLYARYADQAHADGTVEAAAPGLLVGYLDHFGVARDETPLPLPINSWATICRRAYAIWCAGGCS